MNVVRASVLSLSLFAIFPAVQASPAANTGEAFAKPSRLVDIGGRRLHLHCSGEGPVTVVFDAESGGAAWSWFELQPLVARRTRACVYDRAGLGFSDPSPRSGNSVHAVEDLHTLLGKAGIAPPLLLVGTSYGGANVQLYAYKHPSQVKGLVLVDPHHEDALRRENQAAGGKLTPMFEMVRAMEKECAAHAAKGLAQGTEMGQMCLGEFPLRFGRSLRAAALAARMSPLGWQALVSESGHLDEGDAALRAARGSFGDMPVTVLSRGLPEYSAPGQPQSALNKAMEKEHLAINREIAALSSRGELRVVPGSNHLIHASKPHAVADAIIEMVDVITGSKSMTRSPGNR